MTKKGTKVVTCPEDLYKFPRTRSSAVTCLAFGKNRKLTFPESFFCHGCDLFEDAILSGNKRANRNQPRYTCTGGHECDRICPTTLRHRYRPNNNKNPTPMVDGNRSGDDSDMEHKSTRRHTNNNATTPPAYTKSSPTKSPLKKKIRQSQRLLSSTVRPGYAERGSSDEESGMEDDEDGVIYQRFASALSFSADGEPCGNNRESTTSTQVCGDNLRRFYTTSVCREGDVDEVGLVADDVMEYITDLERRHFLLEEHLHKVQQTLNLQIVSLKAEIAELSAKLSTGAAHDMHTPTPELGKTAIENSTKRKNRIDREDKEVSRVLSGIIYDFLMKSELLTVNKLTVNKRRFPTPRLARIVVDSVLAFEWVHCELAYAASSINANLTKRTTTGSRMMNDDTEQHQTSLGASLLAHLNGRYCRCTDKRKAAEVVDCLWNEAFLEGREAKSIMIDRVRKYFRNNVFTPWKILKAMDLAGFNLSLAGIEVLRRVDSADKYSRGFLPSKSSILRAARKVEANADALCPFTMIGRAYYEEEADIPGTRSSSSLSNSECDTCDDFGEGFEFDVLKTTKTLFDAFGLMADAKHRSVELALTSDGAQLTHTLSHVAAGIKFNDMGMRDPFTKQPLLLHQPGSLVQSRNLCFPLRVVIAKDNKKTLDGFRSLYGLFNRGDISTALGCRPLKLSYPGDMKLQWGALDKGGAAKVKENFCYVCPCQSSTLHVPQDWSKCELCKEKPCVNGKHPECYHYQFLASPEVRGKLEDELAVVTALVTSANNDDDDPHQRRMYVRRPGQAAIDGGDKFDIDYRPITARDTTTFSRQVTDELASRSIDVTGSLAVRQQRLRQQLLNEQRVRDLQHMLTHSAPREKAMYLVLQAVVCILHLENRVGLKSIETILRSGLSNAMKGVLEWTVSTGIQKRQDEYVKCITKIVQTRILGTLSAPSQWRFPLTDDGKMGSLSMDNNRTRAIVNLIEAIIEVSFPDSDLNKEKLLRCFPHYRAAIVILRKNTDYTDEEISIFQEHIDAWFRDWVNVYGKEGCTNYTHMLSSSHVMQYMQEWRCLHRYSQQGWEALNALLKSYFFRRTNRGGLAKNSVQKSKLLGIARWLQRRIMWYSGNGDGLFETNRQDYDPDSDFDDSSYCSSSDNEGSSTFFTTSDDDENIYDYYDDDNMSCSSSSSSKDDQKLCDDLSAVDVEYTPAGL